MISGTMLPTTPPTMAPALLFTPELLRASPVWVGDGDEAELKYNVSVGVDVDKVEGRVLVLVLPPKLSVLIGLGVASGSRPIGIATESLYVWFGRLVTL